MDKWNDEIYQWRYSSIITLFGKEFSWAWRVIEKRFIFFTFISSFRLKQKYLQNPKDYTVIVASYDVVRSDIAFFSYVNWFFEQNLYYFFSLRQELFHLTIVYSMKAMLFEIRKPNYRKPFVRFLQVCFHKTQQTIEWIYGFSIAHLAHRLILSGTPIQNNALELWKLFDFLMPGYLGSEKQFIRRYQKPLLASSRDRDLEHGRNRIFILSIKNNKQSSVFFLRSHFRTISYGCFA